MTNQKGNKTKFFIILLIIIGVALIKPLYLLGCLIELLVLPLWIGILISLVIKKCKLKIYLYVTIATLLLLPSIGFGIGTADYFRGTTYYFSVKPFTRITAIPKIGYYLESATGEKYSPLGGIIFPTDPFIYPVYYATGRMWIKICGYR